MRSRILLPLLTLAAFAAPAQALADFGHVVSSGESLSSVAAADGLSVAQLAAANGLATDSSLTAGSTLQIPPQSAVATSAPSTSTPATVPVSATSADPDGDGDSDATSTPALSTSSAAVSSSTGYTVQPGDTLSALAARAGVPVDQLAAANGLDPAGILPAGEVLNLGSSAAATPVSTAVTPARSPLSPSSSDSTTAAGAGAGPQPTPQTVSPDEVAQIAAANGVSPSLAEAIGYQESGFNNNLVSSTGATGVMQIEPGTWNYIGQNLASPPPLSPASAQDNIRGGVLLLHSLLGQAGGDPALAAAGYYQGMQSVRQNGMYADTQQYVNNVMALRQRFGGP